MEDLLIKADILVESEIRQRRPIIREDPAIDEIESDVEAECTENQSEGGALAQTSVRRHLDSVRRTFTVRLIKPDRTEIVTNGGTRTQSDLALLAWTGIICIIACIIQGQAFSISIQLGGNSRGRVDDPEFYNALQTFMMQTLALYTVLAPALRSDGPRYEFWAWLLSALSLGSGIAALVVYPFFTMLSPLLACVSSALQALVTLQLVFSLNYQSQGIRMVDIRKGV